MRTLIGLTLTLEPPFFQLQLQLPNQRKSRPSQLSERSERSSLDPNATQLQQSADHHIFTKRYHYEVSFQTALSPIPSKFCRVLFPVTGGHRWESFVWLEWNDR